METKSRASPGRVTGRKTRFEIENLIDEPAEAVGHCAMVGDYSAACKVPNLGQDGRGEERKRSDEPQPLPLAH